MKSKISVILFLLITVFTSCEIGSEEERGRLTQRGKSVFDEWNMFFTSTIINDWLDMAFRFNAYYTADDDEKNDVEDEFLTEYKIRQENEAWELRIDNKPHYSFTFDKPLSEIGAHWICERNRRASYNNYGYDADLVYTIDCVAENTWRLKTEIENAPLYVEVLIETQSVTTTSNELIYNILGEGCCLLPAEQFGENCYLQFTTSSALEHTIRWWKNGILNLTAFNLQGDELPVKATFSQSNNNVYTIEITYRGVTEKYNF